MEIKRFKLFEEASQTNGNTYGMGNVKSPQPAQEPQIQIPEPIEPTPEPINENVILFKEFLLEIKNMTDDEVGQMINENKITIEKMANELIMQRSSIDNIKEQISTLNKNTLFINEKLDNIVKINNLKIK